MNKVMFPRETAQSTLNGSILQPGVAAPLFELEAAPHQRFSLQETRGRPVILTFYPADWSPVCGDQLALYNEVLQEFQQYGARLIGISVDSVWCHQAYAESRHLQFPLLSDFEPKVRSPRPTARMTRSRGPVGGLSLSLTPAARSAGATSRPWASIPVRTAFWPRCKNCRAGSAGFSQESLDEHQHHALAAASHP